ncbi:hypothetical protein Lal_00045159 [Lupinus albus]|nr:hypothetical protein Lal_00045159 [Lupinus albus]
MEAKAPEAVTPPEALTRQPLLKHHLHDLLLTLPQPQPPPPPPPPPPPRRGHSILIPSSKTPITSRFAHLFEIFAHILSRSNAIIIDILDRLLVCFIFGGQFSLESYRRKTMSIGIKAFSFLGREMAKPTLKALKEVEERLEHRVVEKIEKHIVELAGPENYIELGKGKAKPNLTLAYMKERRVEGLHLHPIELEDEKPEEVVEEMVDFKEYRESYILANTLTSAGIMTMIGNNMKKSLPLFVDSGNIYKCLGVKVAKKLGCLLVTVVDGNKVQMLSSVKNCKWNLHHATSLSDIMVMLLGCWDMPLKIDWLVVLGDTLLGILTN